MPAPEEGHGADEVGAKPIQDAVDAGFACGADPVEVRSSGHGYGGAVLARVPIFPLVDAGAVTWSTGQVRGSRVLPITY